MSHILLTGSSGTVGTALAHRLLNLGHKVTCVDVVSNPWSEEVQNRTSELDLKDENNIAELPTDADLIVHLAANARVYRLIENPAKARENLLTTYNILEYARQTSTDIVFASSREVYGNRDKMIHEETDALIKECESPYTASKVGGEALVKSFENCYDINTSVLRFSNVYGRYDRSNRVVPLFIAQAAHDKTLTVYGSNKVLDFTYIDDCVDGIQAVIESFEKSQGETFNIASGTGSSLVELAETIRDVMDSDSAIEIKESRTGEVARFVANTNKAVRILGYEPNYGLQAGIKETVEWYEQRDLYDNILDANSV